MMTNKIALATLMAALSFAASTASAQLITFDDLTANGSVTAINNGYAGLNWDNFYILDTTHFTPSGFVNGTVSGHTIAYNDPANPNPATISNSNGFNLVGANFTGGWSDNLQIEAFAISLNNNNFYYLPFMVNSTGSTYETFNWNNITSVAFYSSGGTDAGYKLSGMNFVLDNLTITTPVPAAIWLVCPALAGLLGFVRRKRFL